MKWLVDKRQSSSHSQTGSNPGRVNGIFVDQGDCKSCTKSCLLIFDFENREPVFQGHTFTINAESSTCVVAIAIGFCIIDFSPLAFRFAGPLARVRRPRAFEGLD